MHPAIRDIWVDFNEPLEGYVPRMYADVKNLITVAMGNLIDPIEAALKIDWELPDGSTASKTDVTRSWNAVKRDPRCATRGWRYAAALPGNIVQISRETGDKLIFDKLDEHDLRMRVRFEDWESRPADAQLAIHSMAWAMGPLFFKKFPRFTAAFTRGDYGIAAAECAISPAHGTIVERNARSRQLLLNAFKPGPDPSVLVWQLP